MLFSSSKYFGMTEYFLKKSIRISWKKKTRPASTGLPGMRLAFGSTHLSLPMNRLRLLSTS